MMMMTLLGKTLRVRSMSGLMARIAAMTTLAMTLNCASAEHTIPTRSKPTHARHAVSEQSYPVKHGVKAVAAKRGARVEAKRDSKKPAAKKPGARAARDAARQTPHGKTRGAKRKAEELPADEPTMYRTSRRRGRHGASLLLVHGRVREVTRSVVIVSPSPLRGTHDILVHQNVMADEAGLERIRDEEDLNRLRTSRQLVDFEETRDLHVNPELPYDRRCARLWTVMFANDLSHAFYARFGEPLIVTSAARSVEYQTQLQRRNGNAAGTDGDAASPHLTGQAIDLGKRGMSRAELAWMRSNLMPLIQSGKIDVEEEFKQACFHISVYRSYLPTLKHEYAQLQTVPMEPPTSGAMLTAPQQ
jgi:hypothetical protein